MHDELRRSEPGNGSARHSRLTSHRAASRQAKSATILLPQHAVHCPPQDNRGTRPGDDPGASRHPQGRPCSHHISESHHELDHSAHRRSV